MNNNDALSIQEILESGIRITSSTNCFETNGIIVQGKYKVPYANGSIPDQALLLPKHIAMVVTRRTNYKAIKPFSKMVVFEDDVQDDGEYGSGVFTLNVFDHIEFKGEGNYYVICSLGSYLSNIIKVTVE